MNRRQAVSLGASAAVAAAGGITLAGGMPGSAFAQSATPSAPLGDGSSLATGLLPDHRLLLYYGFPENDRMGILGEYDPDELLTHLKAEAANYVAADNSRPWKLGFELIASVAQGSPGVDGKYIADTDGKWLDLYTEFTAQNDMVLFLDVQMGFKTPKEDYVGLERWLKYDHVHLGIDPEFHMREGELPGQDIGQIDGSDVTEAQNWLVEIATKYNVSRKTLIVHQFHYTMIENKDTIKPVHGVDLVIDEDGFGPPAMKKDTYNVVITQEPIEYNGIKLFYKQDDPIMTAAEVLALDPPPDVVIYQ
ncbi:MAG: hypothetical protein ACTHMX_14990 [Thermomicrobiales bacterium]